MRNALVWIKAPLKMVFRLGHGLYVDLTPQRCPDPDMGPQKAQQVGSVSAARSRRPGASGRPPEVHNFTGEP